MIDYQQVSNVPGNTESTVLSITNTGSIRGIQAIGVNCSARCLWNFYKNTNLIAKRRTGTSNPSLTVPFYGVRLEDRGYN